MRSSHEGSSHARRLLKGGAGSLSAAVVLLALPVVGHHYLPEDDYARWALLSTVATVGLSLDFGGTAYAGAQAARGRGLTGSALAGGAMTAVGVCLATALAALAWPHLEAHAVALAGDTTSVVLVVAVGAACVLRGFVLAGAGALLGSRRYGARTALMLGQALAQLTTAVVWLAADPQLWVLPASIALSSGLLLPVLLVHLRKPRGTRSAAPAVARASSPIPTRFALLKGAATGLSLLLTQVDRWVLALLASPALLGTYDLAARASAVPKLLVLIVLTGVAAEAARADGDPAELGRLHRTARRLGVRTITAASAIVLLLVGGVVLLREASGASAVVGLVAGMLLWNGVHALTAPGALVLTGLGRPDREVGYLLLAVLVAAMLWGAGLLAGSVPLVLLAPGVGLVAGSSWFLRRGYTTSVPGGTEGSAPARAFGARRPRVKAVAVPVTSDAPALDGGRG